MNQSLIMLVLMLIGIGAAVCLAVVFLMAWALTHPPRMTDGKAAWVLRRLSPGDLGLAFEELAFDVRDENGSQLNIAAWWIPHDRAEGRCAVLIHGYADAKVGAIAWGPVWHSLGFNLLVVDLRAHGESGGSVCTAGFQERHDLAQVIDDLRARRPEEARRVVLVGISLGAAVAAAAALETSDIAAVVMESPYADFPRAAMAHMDQLGAPGRPLQRAAIRLAEWLTGVDYDAIRPSELVARVPSPVLIIEPGNDPFLAPDDRAAFERAVASRSPEQGPSEIWTVQNVEHLMALSADPEAYRERLRRFLRHTSVLARSPDTVAS